MKINAFRHFFVQNLSRKPSGNPPENPRNFGGFFPRFFRGSALETVVPGEKIRGKFGGKFPGKSPEIPKFPEIPGNFGRKRAVFGNFDTLLRSELFFRSCWRAKTEKKKSENSGVAGNPIPGNAPKFPPEKSTFFEEMAQKPRKRVFRNVLTMVLHRLLP